MTVRRQHLRDSVTLSSCLTRSWVYSKCREEGISLSRPVGLVWADLVPQSWLTPIGHFDHRKLSRSKISVLLLLLAPINIPHTVFGRRRRRSERQALSPTAAEDVFETGRGAEDDEDEDLPRPVAD